MVGEPAKEIANSDTRRNSCSAGISAKDSLGQWTGRGRDDPGRSSFSADARTSTTIGAEALGDPRRQFEIVQNDLDQIRAYLENLNIETKPVVTPPVTPASPTYQQPYLFPTGRERK